MRMGSGFTDEEYAVRDASIVLEDALNKAIGDYLDMPGFEGTNNALRGLTILN